MLKVPAAFVGRPALFIVALEQQGHGEVEFCGHMVGVNSDGLFQERYSTVGIAHLTDHVAVVVPGCSGIEIFHKSLCITGQGLCRLIFGSMLIALLDQVFHVHGIFKHCILHWNILLNTFTQSLCLCGD